MPHAFLANYTILPGGPDALLVTPRSSADFLDVPPSLVAATSFLADTLLYSIVFLDNHTAYLVDHATFLYADNASQTTTPSSSGICQVTIFPSSNPNS